MFLQDSVKYCYLFYQTNSCNINYISIETFPIEDSSPLSNNNVRCTLTTSENYNQKILDIISNESSYPNLVFQMKNNTQLYGYILMFNSNEIQCLLDKSNQIMFLKNPSFSRFIDE